MYSIDKSGRLGFPSALFEFALGKDVQNVVLAMDGIRRYRVIAADNIPSDAKVVSGVIKINMKCRLFIPAPLRRKHTDSVMVYVQDGKLFIEFEE